MKKIILSFIAGLLLSIIPITSFASSGKSMRKAVSDSIIFIESVFCCPDRIYLEDARGLPVVCDLIPGGESPDDGSGVSVCAYDCHGNTGVPSPESTPRS